MLYDKTLMYMQPSSSRVWSSHLLLVLVAITLLLPLEVRSSFVVLPVVVVNHHHATSRQYRQHGTRTTPTTVLFAANKDTTADTTTAAPTILYESDRILAIHKPQGIAHHDDGDVGSGILSVVRRHQKASEIAYQGRIYGVHRLDRVTTGILLLAKDAETAKILSHKFRDGAITKYYCGISAKKPTKKKQGWVKGNMIKGRRKSWMLTRGGKGQERTNFAETRFFTSGLSSLSDHLLGKDEYANDDKEQKLQQQPKTLILFRPYSGRTHQLRVAAKSVGIPLLGDPTYKDGSYSSNDGNDGDDDNNDDDDEALSSAARTYLHACALHFKFDDNDEEVTIWSPPPFGDVLWDPTGSQKFEELFQDLVRKHCDCDAILQQS